MCIRDSFTIGKKILEPHEIHVKDFDVVYLAFGRGVTACAGLLQKAFVRCYACATAVARMLFALGNLATGMEDRDPNWNIAMFGSVLVALAAVVLLGVGL